MYFGACYYPEHWPEERWELDAKMMQEARFNTVRMGEFAWTKMEGEEGKFDFSWLNKAIRIFGEHGIQTILGTPSAAPPKWLIDKHPDICPVDYEGRIMGFGHRRYYCFNNTHYHHYIRAFVEKMAEEFANNPHVFAWQIDNEFGCGGTARCYCENCRHEFILWLQKKYGSLEAVNETWGTVFSNQTYGSWNEIILPSYCALNTHNPGLGLDYRRFASDSVVRFQKIQMDILRDKLPGKLITHNVMGGLGDIDYFKLCQEQDVVSLDIYPNCNRSKEISTMNPAIQHDAARGIKNANYWILEHQIGTPGGGILFRTPRPGDIRRWTYQSIAHGADAIVYFRFRSCLFGVEEYWHGILNHSGLPNQKYEEVKRVGEEIDKLSGHIEASQSGARVAMVRSFDLNWVFEIQPHVEGYSYAKHFLKYYRYFYENNIPVDIVSLDANFSSYQVVVIPNLIMVEDYRIEALQNYVKQGGCLILDFRTGAKEWNNKMVPLVLPGKFRSLLGVEVEDYGILMKEESATLKLLHSEKTYQGSTWYDVINVKEAEPLVLYASDYYKGKAAVTYNLYGAGKVYYFGTEVDHELMCVVMDDICRKYDIAPLLELKNNGVEVCQRVCNHRVVYFIINHKQTEQEIELKGVFRDLITDRTLMGIVSIEKNGVLVVERTGV